MLGLRGTQRDHWKSLRNDLSEHNVSFNILIFEEGDYGLCVFLLDFQESMHRAPLSRYMVIYIKYILVLFEG